MLIKTSHFTPDIRENVVINKEQDFPKNYSLF